MLYRRLFVCFLIIITFKTVFAQKDTVALKYGNTITAEDLNKHLSVLASDEYEGRETGQKGQKMAAKYIAEYFKSLGIPAANDSGYYQSFELYKTSVEQASFKIGGKEIPMYENYFVFFNGTSGVNIKPGTITYAMANPKKKSGKVHVKNNTVLICNKNDFDNINIYEEDTVSAVIIIDNDYQLTYKSFGHYISKPSLQLADTPKKTGDKAASAKKMPVLYVDPKTAEQLLAGLSKKQKKSLKKIAKKAGTAVLEIESKADISIQKKKEIQRAENVLGYIEGTDKKDELIVITAHYDHLGKEGNVVFNGADDDGSGTVSVLEIAQAFMEAKKQGYGPRRSVLIMPVSGEEKGLLGSKYYSEHPVYPLENTVANLNIDMVGRVDSMHTDSPNYVYLIGADILSKELYDISTKANDTYSNLKLDYKYADINDPNRFYFRSDHYNFAKNNVPVIFYFNGVHRDYHQETDEVNKINFELMQKRARLVFFTAWELANRENRIKLNEKKK